MKSAGWTSGREGGGKLVKFLESRATKDREDAESERKSGRRTGESSSRRRGLCTGGTTVCWWPAKAGRRGNVRRRRRRRERASLVGLCWNSPRCAPHAAPRSSRWKCKTATSLGIKWLNKIQLNPPSRLGYADRGIPGWRLMRNAARCRDRRDLPQRDRLRPLPLLVG